MYRVHNNAIYDGLRNTLETNNSSVYTRCNISFLYIFPYKATLDVTHVVHHMDGNGKHTQDDTIPSSPRPSEQPPWPCRYQRLRR